MSRRRRAGYRDRDVGGPPKDQPWAWYTAEMLQSDAWRDMSINDRRMLDILELEHMAHGGRENGKLITTYDQFVAGGIRREAISATIANVERLGWVEVLRGGNRGFARAWEHRYRLTYRRTVEEPEVGAPYLVEPTDDWRRYKSPPKEPKKSIRIVTKPALISVRKAVLKGVESRKIARREPKESLGS